MPTSPSAATPSPATSRPTWIQPHRSPSPSVNEPGSFLPQGFSFAVPSAGNAVPQTLAGRAHSRPIGLTLRVTPSEGFPLHPFLQVNLCPVALSGISGTVFMVCLSRERPSPALECEPSNRDFAPFAQDHVSSGLSSTCHLVRAP